MWICVTWRQTRRVTQRELDEMCHFAHWSILWPMTALFIDFFWSSSHYIWPTSASCSVDCVCHLFIFHFKSFLPTTTLSIQPIASSYFYFLFSFWTDPRPNHSLDHANIGHAQTGITLGDSGAWIYNGANWFHRLFGTSRGSDSHLQTVGIKKKKLDWFGCTLFTWHLVHWWQLCYSCCWFDTHKYQLNDNNPLCCRQPFVCCVSVLGVLRPGKSASPSFLVEITLVSDVCNISFFSFDLSP